MLKSIKVKVHFHIQQKKKRKIMIEIKSGFLVQSLAI